MNKNLKAPHARETYSGCCWTRASMTEPYNATRSAQLASHRCGLDDLERELESMEDWRAAMAVWKSDMVVVVESH
jgi:hypothetical protein